MAALFMTLRSPFVESFKVAFLDKDNRVLDIRVTSVGDIASAPAPIVSTIGDIPEGAVSYIISHNHPSGDPDPSNQDQGVTSRFRTYAKEAFGLEMLDHIITNGKSFYSFQNGKIINFTTPYKESWEASDGTTRLDSLTKYEAFIKDNLRNGRDGEYIHVIYLNHHLKINAIRRIPVSEITKGGYIHSDTLKSSVFKDVGKFGACYLMIDACGLYGYDIDAEMRAVSTVARNTGLRVLDVAYRDEYSDFRSAARTSKLMLAEDGQKYLTTADGIVYGGVHEDGEIYLNEDGLDPDAMISEYTRLWAESVRKNEPVLWEQGKHIFKKSVLWNQVKQDTGLRTDDDIASEVLARLSGKNGSALIEEMMKSGKNPGKKEVEYLRKFWTGVKNQFMPWSKNENTEIDIRAFSLMPVADLVAGRNPMSDLSDRQFKIATSEKFIREHGNWMEDPDSADIELDEHGEPVLNGNGSPLPRLSNPDGNTTKKEVMSDKSFADSSLQREIKSVYDAWHKPDGTANKGYMFAPTKRPTNLTEKQWLQVRTPSFKKKYGDWEKKYYTKGWYNIMDHKKIHDMNPVDISSVKPVADKSEIIEVFKDFVTAKNATDGMVVGFPTNAAGRFVFVKNYVRALKYLFETSKRAWSERETKYDGHKEHRNILEYHQYVNKFSTTEGEFWVRITVRTGHKDTSEGENNIHAAQISSVSVYKKRGDADGFLDRNVTPAQENGTFPHVDLKLALYFEGVKPQLSIKVDENGEPILYENGSPIPIQSTPKVEANVETGKDGLPNTLRVESKGAEAHGTSITRESIIQLVHKLFPEVAIQGPATHSMRGAAGDSRCPACSYRAQVSDHDGLPSQRLRHLSQIA